MIKIIKIFKLDASANDPTVLSKYKLGYTECVQECLRFVNNNASNTSPIVTSSSASPSVHALAPSQAITSSSSHMDHAARQRLISNLMRQFQSVNSMHMPTSMPFPLTSSQHQQIQHESSILRDQQHQNQQQQQQQNLKSPCVKAEPEEISPLIFSQALTSNGHSAPASPDNKMSRNNFRRSSVSPISSSSSSSSSNYYAQSTSTSADISSNLNNNNNSSTHQCENLSGNESSSYQIDQDQEQDQEHDLLNSSSQSLRAFDTSSSQYDQSVWRPW